MYLQFRVRISDLDLPRYSSSLHHFPLLDNHVLVTNQHLHFILHHEIVVVPRQGLARRIIHELGKVPIIAKHKRAYRIKFRQWRVVMQHIRHGGAVFLQVVA